MQNKGSTGIPRLRSFELCSIDIYDSHMMIFEETKDQFKIHDKRSLWFAVEAIQPKTACSFCWIS